MIEGIIPAEIEAGPEAIRATLRDSAAAASSAAAALRGRGSRRVFVIGNGTSYHSALAASALYARHAGPDDPVVIALTAGGFRTHLPALGPADALVGISASGEFRDVIGVVDELDAAIPSVGVVHVPGSTLARSVDHAVVSSGGASSVPVMTKTFSATLVATQLVLLGLLGDECVAGVRREIAAAADHAAAAISSAEQQLEALVDAIAGARHLFVVGAGLAHIAAMEAALKLKEVALVQAEGSETWEMTSGAATMLDEKAAVIALLPSGAGREATIGVVRHAAGWGATTVEVGPGAAVGSSVLVDLPSEATEDHAPLTAVPPIALIAYALARRRGIDPDRPDWVERYQSQGLDHLIGARKRP
jgi:glucosamine--fructose-6-phosphate aminotransferase (isomerizing)